MKYIVLTFLLALPLRLAARDIRLTLSPAWLVKNELTAQYGPGVGGGIHLGYIVKEGRWWDLELNIANHFHRFPLGPQTMDLFRLGFGIRILAKTSGIRPYFTHDIQAGYVWRRDAAYHANTLSVLLGLGLQFPLRRAGRYLLLDLDYQFMHVGHFAVPAQDLSFTTLTLGWRFSL